MSNIEYNFAYWGPFLWHTQVPNNVVNSFLDVGLAQTIDHTTYLASTIDHVKKFDDDSIEWATEQLKPYLLSYIESSREYLNNTDTKNNLKIGAMWINCQKQFESNNEHVHDGDLSFVLYLQVPEQLRQESLAYKGTGPAPGQIRFRYGEYLKWVINIQTFFPKVGQLFVFPAELSHDVTPFASNVERISISGNIILS